jgi:hypothetical protein
MTKANETHIIEQIQANAKPNGELKNALAQIEGKASAILLVFSFD